MSELKRTPLHDEHAALGANFTGFGGWDMPLRYGSELAEHRAVREAAGLFDLSHMGEIRVEGPDAAAYLNTALVGNLAIMKIGKAKYSLLCNDDGGIIDDLITYRLADERFLVVPNAGNAEAVMTALLARADGFDVEVVDETADTALIAVQGPKSAAILAELAPELQSTIDELGYYAGVPDTIDGADVLLARTGYTGEDGFELFVKNADAVPLWRALLATGEPHGLIPAGLACRDSLRMEAGMPLYGNELGLDVLPTEANLGGVVSLKKEEQFVGRAALEAAKAAGPARVLVGLKGQGRRAGRSGYAVHSPADDAVIGTITSGQPSPTLGYPIALAFVAPEFAEVGTEVAVDLRGKREPFEVVALPFYQRER